MPAQARAKRCIRRQPVSAKLSFLIGATARTRIPEAMPRTILGRFSLSGGASSGAHRSSHQKKMPAAARNYIVAKRKVLNGKAGKTEDS
jgi:hypothetical protein